MFQKREHAETYFNKLEDKKCSCALLTGYTDLGKRIKTIKGFVDGTIKVLFTTEFMARRVDFPNVRIVMNFDLPLSANEEPSHKNYLRRVGRAGRFGRDGIIVTILANRKSFDAYKKLSESFNFKLRSIDF